MDTNTNSTGTGSTGNGSAATTTKAAGSTYSAGTGTGTSTGTGSTAANTAALRSDLTNFKNDLDALVNRSASMSDEELSAEHARLMAKFSSVRHAARGIASEATRQFSRGMETASQQFSRAMETGTQQFNRAMETGTQQFNRSMETTTEYVKEKPMQSVAVAVGTGLLLGLLMGRR